MPGPSHNPEAVERILEYLRANEDRYNAEALDASLRGAGYAEVDIEAARRRLNSWQVGPASSPASPTPMWLKVVLAVLLTIVVIGVVAMAAALVVIGSCLFGYV